MTKDEELFDITGEDVDKVYRLVSEICDGNDACMLVLLLGVWRHVTYRGDEIIAKGETEK